MAPSLRAGAARSCGEAMKVTLASEAPGTSRVDLLALGAKKGSFKKDATYRALDQATGGALSAQVKLEDFEGKPGEALRIAVQGIGARQVLLVGLGDKELQVADARALAARAGQAGASLKTIGIVVPLPTPDGLRAAASGAVLGAYRCTRYLTGDRKPKREL